MYFEIGYSSVFIIVSFCHLLPRHLYLKEAGMKCLTITKSMSQVCIHQMYTHLSNLLCYVDHICSIIYPLILGVKVIHTYTISTVYACTTVCTYIRMYVCRFINT